MVRLHNRRQARSTEVFACCGFGFGDTVCIEDHAGSFRHVEDLRFNFRIGKESDRQAASVFQPLRMLRFHQGEAEEDVQP